jgi:hypothetical protein
MTNLDRQLELDNLPFTEETVNQIYKFFCAKQLGRTKKCLLLSAKDYQPVSYYCTKCWNSEWEGDCITGE